MGSQNLIEKYSNSLFALYKEVESIKYTVLSKNEACEVTNKKISELSKKINELKTNISKDAKPSNKLAVLNEQLESLAKSVENLKKKIPTVFKAQAWKDNRSILKRVYDRFVEATINFLNAKIRAFCFIGAATNKRNKELPAKIAAEKQKLKGLSGEALKEKQKIIEALEEKLKKVLFYENKGNEMRQQFVVLGGEQVQIVSSDNTKLDGLYLDAQAFRKTLKNAGCEIVTMKKPSNAGHPEKLIQMISMSAEKYQASGRDVLEALKKLKAFSGAAETGAGWTLVKEGNNFLFVRTDQLPEISPDGQLQDALFDQKIKGDGEKRCIEWTLKADNQAYKERTIVQIDDTPPASGTVILSTGNGGVYEQHKSEALSYLFRNINVVMFNFRGFGKSEGDPTERGLKLDMEAAYQLGKIKSGHRDKKILFKGLCMSGGPAAFVAAQHPDTNLFLDQSYSDFKTLMKENAKKNIDDYFESTIGDLDPNSIKIKLIKQLKNLVEKIAPKVIDWLAPNYNTVEALSQNRGYKAIFYVHDDEMVNFKHVERNIKAVADARKMDRLIVMSGPGSHGASHLGIKAAPYEFINCDTKKLTRELKDLNKNNNQLHAECENKVKETEKKKTSENAVIIEDEINALKQEYDQKRDVIKARIVKAKEELSASEQNLQLDFGIDAMKNQYVANNQITHFLEKMGLSEDLIKTERQIKRRESPMDRLIKRSNQFVNDLELLKKDLKDVKVKIPKGEITDVSAEKGIFTIDMCQEQTMEKSKFSLSKADLDKLLPFIQRITLLMSESEELSKDLIAPKDRAGESTLINAADRDEFNTLKNSVINLTAAIDKKKLKAELEVAGSVKDISSRLLPFIQELEQIRANIQSELDKVGRGEPVEGNKLNSMIGDVEKLMDKINDQGEQLKKLRERSSNEIDAFMPQDTGITKITAEVDAALKSVGEAKAALESLTASAGSALKLLKIEKEIVDTFGEWNTNMESLHEGLELLMKETDDGLDEVIQYYNQYTKEQWINYFSDKTLGIEAIADVRKALLKMNENLENKIQLYDRQVFVDRPVDVKFESMSHDLDGIKGFDQRLQPQKEHFKNVYEEFMNVNKQNYECLKALQSEVKQSLENFNYEKYRSVE